MGMPTRPAGRSADGVIIATATATAIAIAGGGIGGAVIATGGISGSVIAIAGGIGGAVAIAMAVAIAVLRRGSAGGRRGLSIRSAASSPIPCPSRGRAEVKEAHAGQAMRAAAWLMAPAVRDRWLGEAESFLFEASPGQQAEAIRNYLITAPQVIVASWAAELGRRARRRIRRGRAEGAAR